MVSDKVVPSITALKSSLGGFIFVKEQAIASKKKMVVLTGYQSTGSPKIGQHFLPKQLHRP